MTAHAERIGTTLFPFTLESIPSMYTSSRSVW